MGFRKKWKTYPTPSWKTVQSIPAAYLCFGNVPENTRRRAARILHSSDAPCGGPVCLEKNHPDQYLRRAGKRRARNRHLEDIDEQKRREELLRNQIERDTLTGLYNKGATEEHIRGLMGTGAAQGEYDALFIIDIDDFKGVNDRYGHLYGDKILAESARRIASLFYPEDIIGRIGGDEFAVFLKKSPAGKPSEKSGAYL